MESAGKLPHLVVLILYILLWQADEALARTKSCGLPECPTRITAQIETDTTRETTTAIIVVMSVTVLLIICLVVLLIVLCVKKRAWETHDHREASEPYPTRTTLGQIEENAVEVPSYISDRQMSPVGTYSGPPPYFTIFKIVIPETGEVRSTCIGEANMGMNYMTSVENIEESPPDYNGLFNNRPPAYEEVASSHRKKEVTCNNPHTIIT